MPANMGELLSQFDQVIVPEMNNGQLVNVLRAKYLVPAESITQITGQPFKVSTLEREIRSRVKG
jgi:2-oxoglutarate ferredoxin oxidoreductase subunit alpha